MSSIRQIPGLAPLALLAAAGLHVTPAMAQWTGRGEAGLVLASGNTDTKAGNAKLVVKHKSDPWTQDASFSAVYASDSEESTAQRWEAATQGSYQFDLRNYVFGGLRYESDRFSGFTYQGTASAGVGRKFFDSPETTLTTQVGVGYKFFESREVFSPAGVLLAPRESDNAIAWIGSADFRHAFNASTTLIDKLTAEYTAESTFLQNELSLQVKMSDTLALAIGYAVRHNTDPPAGFEKTDTLTTANIVYEVK